MAKADLITGIVLILLNLYVVIESWRMPRLEHLKIHPLSVPGIVPAFIGTILILFGLILVIRSLHRGGHHIHLSRDSFRQVMSQPGNQRLLLTALLTIGYAVFLIGTFPYWLATGLFILLFILLFEWNRELTPAQRRKGVITALLIAVLSSMAITFIFERLFLVALP